MEEQDVMALPVEGGEASQTINPMADLLDGCGRIVPERGETIEGVLVRIDPTEIVVDIGCKSEGIVTSRDLERLDPKFRKSLCVGDKVLVYVLRPEDSDGNTLLSLSRAQLEGDWRDAEQFFESQEGFEQVVSDCNKGGLIVKIGRVRGFVPASQIVSVQLPREASDDDRQAMLQQVVGKKLHFKVIELDRQRNRLILSERAAVREWRQGQKERLLSELKEGDTRRGVVSSLCDFGAFVDLGGADGLIHLSEISWRRVGHPKQVLTIGDEVDVFVLGVDRDKRRIALSLKRLLPEPWSTIEDRFQIGQLVSGVITNITDFGAFAKLDNDIEGLIHISELSEERIAHPKDVVKEGQELTLRVIRIDANKQRLGLSLRRVNDEQFSEDFDWQETDQLAELSDSAEDSEA